MKELMAYCGLQCHTCPILLATEEPDPGKKHEMRIEIARQIEQHYGTRLDTDQITDCDGCRSDSGRLYAGCRDCPIRPCAQQRGLETCADCGEYTCDKLRAFFAKESQAQKHLDKIRADQK